MTSVKRSSALLDALAAHGIVDHHPAIPSAPLPSPEWDRLLSTAHLERLVPVLAWAISEAAWPASDDQREEALARHRSSMASALLLERLLLDLHDAFVAEEIDHVVLKGPATAHLDAPDPSWRAFADLDLLVAPEHLDRACRVLANWGGHRRYREPRAGFDRRFSKGMAYVLPTGHEVDLHRTLCQGPFGLTIDPAELAAGRERFVVGGVTLDALDQPRRFVHACVHAVLGQPVPRPGQLRDVALSCPRSPGLLLDALALARRWQLEPVVRTALDETSTRLGWEPPGPLRAWQAGTGWSVHDRWRLESYHDTPRAPVLRALTSLAAVPGLREKVAYGLAVAAPTDGRNARVGQRAGRALRALTGGHRR
jgi:hypothetical protein